MTSEEWIALIPNEKDRKYAREAVNAALEREREGEVIWSGVMPSENFYLNINPIKGKRGSLVFRPDTKEIRK